MLIGRFLIGFAILACTLATSAHAEQPPYKELVALLGKEVDSSTVLAFASKHNLDRIRKFDEGAFSSPDQSFSLIFRGGKITRIVLRISPWPNEPERKNWATYASALPAGLVAGDSRPSVIKKLGKPLASDATTDEAKSTWAVKEQHLWILFDKDQSHISEIFVKKGVVSSGAP